MQDEGEKICGVGAAPVGSGTSEPVDPPPEQISGLRRTTLTAMFLALYLMIDILPSPLPPPFTPLFKFTGFSQILAGFVIGPGSGALVGGLGDILHYLLHPRGAYVPFFTLTGAMTGALPALLMGRQRRTLVRLMLCIGLVQVVTKLGIVTPILYFFLGQPWQLRLPIFALEQAIHIPLYAYAVQSVLGQWNAYQLNR